jgi:hypothetical protein
MFGAICRFWLIGVGLLVAMDSANASSLQSAPADLARLAVASATTPVIEGCILGAASVHHLPPAVLVILLNVEGGRLGQVSENNNGTVDVGPMQVNEIWLPKLAEHWHATIDDTFEALRDNFCANVEGGAWILRLALDETRGDFWRGIGIYHSHDPTYQKIYLRQILRQVLQLQASQRSVNQTNTAPAPRN